MTHPSNDNVSSMPYDVLIKEGSSQKDRLLKEVMEHLFSVVPDKKPETPSFTLSDGTKCYVKKFFAPRTNHEHEIIYGFDVILEDTSLSHLEFVVKCSGWERVLVK